MVKYHHFQLGQVGYRLQVWEKDFSYLICSIDLNLFTITFMDSPSLDLADLTLLRKLVIDLENKRFELPVK